MSLASPACTPVCPGACAGITLRQGACGRGGGNGYDQGDKSKSTGMPWGGKGPPAAAVIAEAAVTLLRRCGRVLPCTRIAVSATGFTEVHTDQGTLTGFFEPGTLLPVDAGDCTPAAWAWLPGCRLGPAWGACAWACCVSSAVSASAQPAALLGVCMPAPSCLPPGIQQSPKVGGFLDALPTLATCTWGATPCS